MGKGENAYSAGTKAVALVGVLSLLCSEFVFGSRRQVITAREGRVV